MKMTTQNVCYMLIVPIALQWTKEVAEVLVMRSVLTGMGDVMGESVTLQN